MCTLRNFPHLIEHCIEWSRAMFEDLFVSPARQAALVLDDVDSFLVRFVACVVFLLLVLCFAVCVVCVVCVCVCCNCVL